MSDNGHSRLPWRVDEDNDKRIVVVSADGNLVLITNYSDIPAETTPAFKQHLIAETRANYYFILNQVNQILEKGSSQHG